MFGLGPDYGLEFSSDIRLRHDPQLWVSHLATTIREITVSALQSHCQPRLGVLVSWALKQIPEVSI